MERRLSTSTGLLAALLVFLGVYVYLVEVRGGERQERARQVATQLFPFPPADATELTLQRPDGRIACRKEQGRWRIATPIRADVDETTLARLLADLAEARIERMAAERPTDLAAFGLARPLLITVGVGEKRQSIQVGKENPTGSFVFVRRPPEGGGGAPSPVLLVERRLRTAAETTLYDLRDKSVLDFSPDEVVRITFTHRGRITQLAREPAGPGGAPAGWRLVEPLHARADRGQVERMFNLISYLRAEEFVSEAPVRLQQYGLAPPWGSARFDLRDGRSQVVLIGRRTEMGATTRQFARRPGSGPVFTINDNLPRDAEQSAEGWRERHVTDFARADVAELRLISPARTVVCAKTAGEKGDEWHAAEFSGRVAEGMELGAAARLPTAQRADRDRVEELLAKLSILEVAAFQDGINPMQARFGLASPELKVVTLDAARKTLASVSWGKRIGERRYATGPHLGGLFLLPASEMERFRVGARDLAARS